MSREDRIYIIYDGRAAGGQGTDEALEMSICWSLKEAKREAPDYGSLTSIYSYKDPGEGGTLVNPRWECDVYVHENGRKEYIGRK